MSVRTMAKVWEFSQHGGTNLLMELAIADFSDDEGRAYPSVPTLAKKCRISERQAVRVLKILEDSGELKIQKNTGPRGTNVYRLMLRGMTSASPLTPMSPLTPVSLTPDIQVQKPLTPMSPEPSLNHQEPPVSAKPRKGGRLKSEKTTFKDWYQRTKADGKKVLHESDPVYDYVEKLGLSIDFLHLHWFMFRGKHMESQKLQADWPKTFSNSVKGNFGGLWYRTADGGWRLTTAGKMAAIEHDCDPDMTARATADDWTSNAH